MFETQPIQHLDEHCEEWPLGWSLCKACAGHNVQVCQRRASFRLLRSWVQAASNIVRNHTLVAFDVGERFAAVLNEFNHQDPERPTVRRVGELELCQGFRRRPPHR
jgi:hypothetical protein